MMSQPCRFPRRRPPNKGPGRASATGSTWKKPMALEKKNRFQDIDQIGFFLISTSNLFLASPYTTYPFLQCMSKWFGFDGTIAQRCLTCQGRLDPYGISQVCSTQPDSSQNPFSEIFGSISLPRTSPEHPQNIPRKSTAWSSTQTAHPTPAPACCGTPFDSYAVGRLKILQCKSLDSPLSCWQLIWIIAWKLCVGRSGCSTGMLSQAGKTHEVTRWNLGNCSRSFFGNGNCLAANLLHLPAVDACFAEWYLEEMTVASVELGPSWGMKQVAHNDGTPKTGRLNWLYLDEVLSPVKS